MGKVKTGHIKEYVNPPKSDVDNAEFIVHFRETDNYSGGFGIDYMCGEPERYGSSEIKYRAKIQSNNWAEFEKLYNPTKIQGQPYYTPWISMYKDNFSVTGEQVKLILHLVKTSGNWNNKGVLDEIVFQPKGGLRLVPDRLPAKTADKTEITVFCDKELSGHYLYEVKDQNDNVIGVLNFYKNAVSQQKKIDVKLIRVKLDNSSVNININNIDKWLNKQGLNQGLIQCNFTVEDYDVRIDPKDGKIPLPRRAVMERIFRNDIIDSSNLIIKRFKFYHEILTDYIDQNKNDTTDLRYFFVNLEAQGNEIGIAANGEYVPNNYWKGKDIFIFDKEISLGNKFGTVVHEGLHSQGLSHFFSNGIGESNGKFYFEEKTTDNIMDYYNYGSTDKRKRILKWQWDLIKNNHGN